MSHDEYWKTVMNHSEKTLCGLFDGCRTRVHQIVGDDNGIDDETKERILAASVGEEVGA